MGYLGIWNVYEGEKGFEIWYVGEFACKLVFLNSSGKTIRYYLYICDSKVCRKTLTKAMKKESLNKTCNLKVSIYIFYYYYLRFRSVYENYIFDIFENCCSNLKFAKPTLKASEYWGLVSLSQLGITHLDLGTATEKVNNFQ